MAKNVQSHWQPVVTGATPQILLWAYAVVVQWEYKNLSAPFWRWYYNDAPGAFLIMKNKRIPIEPGMVILIPPHTVFASFCEGMVGHFFMHFTLGLDRTVTPGRIFTHAPTGTEQALIRRLVQAIKESPEGNPLMASFLAQAVINSALAAVPPDYWEGSVTDERMRQALQRLLEDGPEVDNAALAREAGMHVNAFIRRFRGAVGQTPHQYRLHLRIEQACGWLRMETMTMDQIAEAAGFCDRFHFSRVFKQMMGMSPAKFRDAKIEIDSGSPDADRDMCFTSARSTTASVWPGNMAMAKNVQRHWQPVVTGATPQILLWAYSVLLKWEHKNLSAPFWRWYHNDDPGAGLIMKNKRIPIEPGMVILIPPHTAFATFCEGTVGHFFMHFTLGLDRTVTPGRIFTHAPTDAEQALIRRLTQAIKQSPEGNPLMASFLAQAVINSALAAVPPDYWEGSVTDERMRQALQRLLEDGPNVDNAALAREAGMHVNAFIRRFRRAVGQTPHQYRLHLRIEQACGWLRLETMTMDQIAEAAGFCDRFHFSRVFKQVMGMSPAKFRDDMKPAAADAKS